MKTLFLIFTFLYISTNAFADGFFEYNYTKDRTLITTVETPNQDSAMDDVNDALRVNVVAGGSSLGTTGTATQVADTASPITLLASNTDRISSSITNDSSAVLYVLEGAGTVSSTNYTYRLAQYDTVFIDAYTGIVSGIWASDPNDGAARITEIS